MTSRITPSNLVSLLIHRAESVPEQLGYRFLGEDGLENDTLSYAELFNAAQRVAAALLQFDAAGAPVLLTVSPGLRFIEGLFGCLLAGAIAVPTYPPKKRRGRRDERFYAIARNAGATLAITDETDVSTLPACDDITWLNVHELLSHEEYRWMSNDIRSDSIAILQYTSGSTMRPRGVEMTHGNFIHNLDAIRRGFDLSSQSRGLIWLPPYHDMGLIGGILQPLYTGFPCTLMSPASFVRKPVSWLQAISRYRATCSGGPDFAYDLCARDCERGDPSGLDLSSWRVAFTAAEQIRPRTLKKFAEAVAGTGFQRQSFYPCYGLAESTIMVVGTRVQDTPRVRHVRAKDLRDGQVVFAESHENDTRSIVSCGTAIEGQKVIVVDPHTRVECATGAVGEIWVSGPSVARGYRNDAEANAETFAACVSGAADDSTTLTTSDRWLRTGDLGFLEDGLLFVTGRLKDMLIFNGKNHYPLDIEETVSTADPALNTGAGSAFSIEVDGEERLVVAQEVRRQALRQIDAEAVKLKIHSAIASVHGLAVHDILLLKPGALPRTHSGKTQRWLCKERFESGEFGKSIVTCAGRRSQVGNRLRDISFSLQFFSSNEAEYTTGKYRLLVEGAKFADRNGFEAVWIPERHFHAFGGLFPNPAVPAAAIAMVTDRIRLRAGSVVVPLHDPIRVAEEWSVVDNLSDGRVDLSFARGWNPNDFVLAPENYADSSSLLEEGVKTVRHLWEGHSVTRPNGNGEPCEVRIYPLPQQARLNCWITCAKSRQGFEQAGRSGSNVLTALLFQSVEELAGNVHAYRQARAEQGHPGPGRITCMIHTHIAETAKAARSQVSVPFRRYLESSVDLWRQGAESLDELCDQQRASLLDFAFERYYRDGALFGTVESCSSMVERLGEAGVDEIACLIDFGIDSDTVLASLPELERLRERVYRLHASTGPRDGGAGPTTATTNSPDATGAASVVNAAPLEKKPVLTSRNLSTSCAELRHLLRLHAGRALNKRAEEIDLSQPFISQGFDSLMMVSFATSLKSELSIDIDMEAVFSGLSGEQLVEQLSSGIVDPALAPVLAESKASEIDSSPASTNHNRKEVDVDSPEKVSDQERAKVTRQVRVEEFPEYSNLRRMIAATGERNPYFRARGGVNGRTCRFGERDLLNFSSYNYLAMAGAPAVISATEAAVREYGTSVSASRLLSGEITLHSELEQRIAELIGVPAALLYVGGHATNVSTIGQLLGPQDLVLHDALIHNSVLQGCVMSGARRAAFPHNDWTVLQNLLEERRDFHRRVLVVIEGVYSMDGDIPALADLLTLKEEYDAMLMIDEAHSLGTIGASGGGIAEYAGIDPARVDIWMGTLSKSLASCGGYIAGSAELIEYLRYTSSGFVYSVGLSPPNTASALAALDVMEKEPWRVRGLSRQSDLFRKQCAEAGLDTGLSKDSPVIPILIGDSEECLRISQQLFADGVCAFPIIAPAVADDQTRLRFFMSCEHSDEEIVYAVDATRRALKGTIA